MVRTAKYFGEKIFTYYDVPDLPPTNNAHEQVFGRLSRHQRLITAHKSTALRTARDGAFLIPALERARGRLPGVEDIAAVPNSVRQENLRTIAQARERFARPRRLRKNLQTLLDQLRKACVKLRRPRFAPARATARNLRR